MREEERRAGILNKRLTRRELLKGAGGAGLALGLGALAGCAPPAPAPAPAPPPAAPAEVGPTVIKVYV
ncbi:MAG TPA: twin-arginine translocation signal domain-containing protein, partial [Caldilineae bacterium]|nr:twin-arginine translocation signal domain-containing protein [Caldilineae bacterium]